MYFESHAHYDDKRFREDREELLSTLLPASGVDTVINIGCDVKSSEMSIRLAEKYPYVYASVGVHPHEVGEMSSQTIEKLRNLSTHPKAVAIGEIGLDYYYDFNPRELQRFWFRQQLRLAEEVKMPVVIHSRDAAQETFEIIESSAVRRGVIHCYSGALPMAQDDVDMGFHIGIGGVPTPKSWWRSQRGSHGRNYTAKQTALTLRRTPTAASATIPATSSILWRKLPK